MFKNVLSSIYSVSVDNMESFYITFNIMVHSQCSHQISFQHLATFLNQQALKNPLLTIGLTSTVARFSTGSVHLCKPWICWNSAVLRLWLGLGTKKTHLVRVTKPSCFSLKYLILSPQTRLKNVPIIHLKKKQKTVDSCFNNEMASQTVVPGLAAN